MQHLDLFSGIGGFAYAVDQVWPNSTHIFCDNNKFCQKVLAKHWPGSVIYGDIRQITTNTTSERCQSGGGDRKRRHILYDKNGVSKENKQERNGRECGITETSQIDILTGGFPCQPFSQAGKRKGTADDRYLWPEMFRVIQLTKPTWVIAENVRGLVTWNEGMVLEQVCTDLETEGYEVQPFIIPACAVNAPHRRDRVWIIAHSESAKTRNTGGVTTTNKNASNNEYQRSIQSKFEKQPRSKEGVFKSNTQWDKNWVEVATKLCGVDDGLPVELDELKLSKTQNRAEQLKAYGNAIVPQVAMQIMQAIKQHQLLVEVLTNQQGDKS